MEGWGVGGWGVGLGVGGWGLGVGGWGGGEVAGLMPFICCKGFEFALLSICTSKDMTTGFVYTLYFGRAYIAQTDDYMLGSTGWSRTFWCITGAINASILTVLLSCPDVALSLCQISGLLNHIQWRYGSRNSIRQEWIWLLQDYLRDIHVTLGIVKHFSMKHPHPWQDIFTWDVIQQK